MLKQNMIFFVGVIFFATILNQNFISYALPVAASASTECLDPTFPEQAEPTLCCPKRTSIVKDFEPPVHYGNLRVRRPAHLLDENYIEKYIRAVQLMKALPPEDPRSYAHQASIHCAYCNGAYRQLENTDLEIQIHYSWLFFPFHRFYLYFHEKILGSLVGDPDFALPFWSWDSPEGMQIPFIFTDPSSPLYDAVRHQDHLPPKIVDLNYNYVERNISDNEQVQQNLALMYRNMVSNGRTGSLFFGKPYKVGSAADPGGGSMEDVPHNSVHIWVGDNNRKNLEHMGGFYTSAKDPLFFPHHTNMDRLWSVWRGLGGKRRVEINEFDWLEASFILYDENGDAVRVKVKDSLRMDDLGYRYEDVEVPWINARPTPRRRNGVVTDAVRETKDPALLETKLPALLNRVITATVERGKSSRSREEEEQDEILVIEGIEVQRDVPAKFDVMINEVDWSKCSPANTEFAGSFVNVPSIHKRGSTLTRSLRLSLTDLLHDLGAEDSASLRVTLVPRYGKEHIKIGGIKVIYE